MSSKSSIGKIIKGQRKSIPLTLQQLSEMSGVSKAHLGRIEQGLRKPSTYTLQKIAKPLGFDLYELLVITGHLLPDSFTFSEEAREKLRTELNALLEQFVSNSYRLKEIINRLLLTR